MKTCKNNFKINKNISKKAKRKKGKKGGVLNKKEILSQLTGEHKDNPVPEDIKEMIYSQTNTVDLMIRLMDPNIERQYYGQDVETYFDIIDNIDNLSGKKSTIDTFIMRNIDLDTPFNLIKDQIEGEILRRYPNMPDSTQSEYRFIGDGRLLFISKNDVPGHIPIDNKTLRQLNIIYDSNINILVKPPELLQLLKNLNSVIDNWENNQTPPEYMFNIGKLWMDFIELILYIDREVDDPNNIPDGIKNYLRDTYNKLMKFIDEYYGDNFPLFPSQFQHFQEQVKNTFIFR